MSLINEVSTTEKVIAITFDDGPNPLYTPQIIDIFAKANSKATFFMIGEQIEKSPEIVKLVAEQGHEIGNHTFSHEKLTQLGQEECREEIKRNEELIQNLSHKKPVILRPPYLDYNDETTRFISHLGYSMIGALNIDATDWEQPGVKFILEKTRKHIKSGGILLFHDGYGDRSQTITAVRQFVPELVSQGYKLVTVSELLQLAE